MNVLKKAPVAPSAWNHDVDGADDARVDVTAGPEPSRRRREVHRALGDHRLRRVDDDAERAARQLADSRRRRPSCARTRRSATVFTTGVSFSRRNVSVAVVGVAFALAISM